MYFNSICTLPNKKFLRQCLVTRYCLGPTLSPPESCWPYVGCTSASSTILLPSLFNLKLHFWAIDGVCFIPCASYQIHKIACCTCAGNPGDVSPPPWVSDSENVPGISGACATRNFTYLLRGPWIIFHTRVPAAYGAPRTTAQVEAVAKANTKLRMGVGNNSNMMT